MSRTCFAGGEPRAGQRAPVGRGHRQWSARAGSSRCRRCRTSRSVTGMGVSGTIEGRRVEVGNAAHVVDAGSTLALTRAEALRQGGQTVVFVAVDGRVAGLLGVADPIKATSSDAVRGPACRGRSSRHAHRRQRHDGRGGGGVARDRRGARRRAARSEGGGGGAPAGGRTPRRDGRRRRERRARAGHGGRRHRDGHRNRCRDGKRRHHARQGRPARYRSRPPSEPGDDAEHPAEPVLRLHLQHGRRAGGGRRVVSVSSGCCSARCSPARR